MGFFSKLGKALNPVEHLKNPKKALKNAAMLGVDPAGTVIRAGRGVDTINGRSMLDPAGFADPRQPTNYAPYTPGSRPLQLSAGAQKLYDSMKARTAAREAARAQPQVQQPMAQPQQPMAPRRLADGGKVSGYTHVENKAGEHKRNGKYR